MFRLAAAATLAAFLLLAPPGADAASKVQMYSEAANLIIKTKLADGKVLIDGKDLTAVFTQVDGLKKTIASLKAGTTTITSTTATTTTTTDTTTQRMFVATDDNIKCAALLYCSGSDGPATRKEWNPTGEYGDAGFDYGAEKESENEDNISCDHSFAYIIAGKPSPASWETSAVKTMAGLFAYEHAQTTLSSEDGIPIRNTCNPDVSAWETSAVTDMSKMFFYMKAFNRPLDGWQTDLVTSFEQTFQGNYVFDQNIDGWQTSSAVAMKGMFSTCREFNQPLNSWQTGGVPNMMMLFNDAQKFNQNIDSWTVAQVTDFKYTFGSAALFNHVLPSWSAQQPSADMFGMYALGQGTMICSSLTVCG